MTKKGKVVSMKSGMEKTDSTNYSEVFRGYIDRVYHMFSPQMDDEEIMEICVQAWNYAILGLDMPKEEFDGILNRALLPPSVMTLLNKLVNEKNKWYKKYDQCIIDYRKEHFEDQELLELETISKEGFIIDMLEEELDDDDHGEDLSGYTNRNAIVVSPQKPFIDWVKRVFQDEEDWVTGTSKVYLIDEEDDPVDWLEHNFDFIFFEELNSQCSDSDEHPTNRTLKMFHDWFKVDYSLEVIDVESFPDPQEPF